MNHDQRNIIFARSTKQTFDMSISKLQF